MIAAVDPATWWLVCASVRLWAVLRAQVAWRRAVGPSWAIVSVPLGVGLALAAEPHGARVATEPLSMVDVGAQLAIEIGLGTVVGRLVALPGYGLVGALEQTSGILVGAGHGPRSLVGLGMALATWTALAMRLHQPMLTGVFECLTVWPVGQPWAWAVEASGGASRHQLFAGARALGLLAWSFATPVLLLGAMVELLAAVAGAKPSLVGQLATPLSPWVRLGACGIALWSSWLAYGGAWGRAVVSGVP
ncbi:MAG: hypothetical protein B7733_16870 [Myxococcales bacterium FL481]|nr:MAG: hypothetical protein B7733_16870 [Myxococcales bacterium FL481]